MRVLLLLAPVIVLMGRFGMAQELRPGRLSREEIAALVPGLLVEFQSRQTDQTDWAAARLPALYVPQHEGPTPFLPPGPFRAVYSGYLKTRLRGIHRFHLFGNGAVRLSINDRVVAEAEGGFDGATYPDIELVKGYNKLRIEYFSPRDGTARLRVCWSSEDFYLEPLSPELLAFDGRQPDYQRAAMLLRGRMLVAQLRCLKCHGSAEAATATIDGMPELQGDAPDLARADQRLNAPWIAAWILDPASLRHDATMPAVVDGGQPDSARTAADLASYLTTPNQLAADHSSVQKETSARGDKPAIDPATDVTVQRGELLFEERGCLACHRFTPPAQDDAPYQRVSLHYCAVKFKPGSLSTFLQDVRHDYRWSRMPRFHLTAAEAEALEAYIRHRSTGVIRASWPEGNRDRGQRLFQETGCAHCHASQDRTQLSTAAQRDLFHADTTKGCLSESPPSQAPRFSMSDEDHRAIRAFLRTDGSSLQRRSAAEFAQRQIEQLRCAACHARDGVDADLPALLIDEGVRGRVPDPVPPLTWAGEKLHSDWISRMLQGKLSYRTREHFRLHMPEFPTRGAWLADGLAMQHGIAPSSSERPEARVDLARAGESIAAMNTGLACHRCHAIGDQAPSAPLDARSTNFAYARDRLRYEFYLRWMFDPLRVDPGTKMLKFSPDGKTTALVGHFEGDAQRQYDALWHYLLRLGASVDAAQSRNPLPKP